MAFALQNRDWAAPQLPGLAVRPLPVETGTAKFDLSLYMEEAESGLGGWFDSQPGPTTAFSVAMPDVPDVAVLVKVDGYGSTGFTTAWRYLRPGMTDVAIVVPSAPVLLSPAIEATDVPRSSMLSWSESPVGVYVLAVDGPDAGAPQFRVITTETSVPLSELDGLVRIPTSTSMTWRATAIGPFAGMDGAATLAGYPTVAGLTDSHVVQNEDRVVARSSGQSFTVAP